MEHKTYLYKLQGIDLIEKYVHSSKIKEGDQFNFNIRTQSAINDVQQLVIVIVETNILKINESEVMGKFVTAFGFEIQDMGNSFEKDIDNKYLLPLELENLLKSISISTMRGIIFSELRGTAFHNVIMPVIQMDSLKPEEGNLIDYLRNEK